MRVSVIIPTHNEALSIERVLADLPSDLTTEVIVVDSNSNDGTPEIAARMGARVVQEPRRGYGRACLTGLDAANSPDVVVFLDGDYSDRPSELPILLAPITEGRADITLGSRLLGQRSAGDRKSTRLNSSHGYISYAVFCLKKKKKYYFIFIALKEECHN